MVVKHVIFYITAPDMEQGKKIAHALVEQKLAACVNIVPQVFSCYRWAGKVETANECLLMGKTTVALVEALKQRVNMMHPYDVPEIVFVNITHGLESYLQWIDESVSG